MEVLKERYTITELSDMLQLTDHALRFYEKEFELTVPKDERGRRYYTADLANTMYKVKVMRSEGLEIKAIKKILQDESAFVMPQAAPDADPPALIIPDNKEYEAIQLIFSEIGKQLTKELSFEIDSAREHLSREITKSKLELGACVENGMRRLENKMEKHYQEVDKALGDWRNKKGRHSIRAFFVRLFRRNRISQLNH
ncbi:MAG TPA: MerR family transcriptional regulator [Clostridia bacterium]|nr:MerR family transcriptional regulator [Clostridia bacterium]